jgi:hypothetical protein
MQLLCRFEGIVQTTGITLLIALLVSVLLKAVDPAQRALGNEGIRAVALLYFPWVAIAVPFVLWQFRSVPAGLWGIVMTNVIIFVLCLNGLFGAYSIR